jgi:hypothetical protein
LLGPFLNLHLSGGARGINHVIDRLGPPIESWWRDLGDLSFTPKVRAEAVAGVEAELSGRDLATLTAQRDEILIRLLALKAVAEHLSWLRSSLRAIKDEDHPERVLLGHPFNPPHLIPLVEVVGGRLTSPQAIHRALAFYAEIGKKPIHIRREVKGHMSITDRIKRALAVVLQDDTTTDPAAELREVLPPSLRAERRGAVAVMHLHRAEKRNALNDTLVQRLVAFFDSLPDDIRVVVLAGDSEHFSAGLDLTELEERDVFGGVTHSS